MSNTGKFCTNSSGWWKCSLSPSPKFSLDTICTNLTLQRRVYAYLLQGNFLLYLERFWPSLPYPSPHVFWKSCSVLSASGLFFSRRSLARLLGIAEGGSLGMHWSTPASARWEWPVLPPQPLQGCSITTPVWAGQGDARGSLLNFQPPSSVWAPTSKAAQPCGSWHLLKVNSDTFYSSIFFLMLWKQLHVTEAFKTLPFI